MVAPCPLFPCIVIDQHTLVNCLCVRASYVMALSKSGGALIVLSCVADKMEDVERIMELDEDFGDIREALLGAGGENLQPHASGKTKRMLLQAGTKKSKTEGQETEREGVEDDEEESGEEEATVGDEVEEEDEEEENEIFVAPRKDRRQDKGDPAEWEVRSSDEELVWSLLFHLGGGSDFHTLIGIAFFAFQGSFP